jgi:hypothetical protein
VVGEACAALHRLEDLDAVLFPQIDQGSVVEGRAVVELTRFVERDTVGEDFNLPGVRGEPGLDQVIPLRPGAMPR